MSLVWGLGRLGSWVNAVETEDPTEWPLSEGRQPGARKEKEFHAKMMELRIPVNTNKRYELNIRV